MAIVAHATRAEFVGYGLAASLLIDGLRGRSEVHLLAKDCIKSFPTMTEEVEQLLKNLRLRRVLDIYDEQARAAEAGAVALRGIGAQHWRKSSATIVPHSSGAYLLCSAFDRQDLNT